MNRVILIKYGELTTKKGNRKFFINTLYKNINDKLKGYDVKISKDISRMYIEFMDKDLDKILKRINSIFGIHEYLVAYKVTTEVSTIEESVKELVQKSDFDTFKVETKRSYKAFPYNSVEFSKKIGGVVLKNTEGKKVDVHNPDIYVNIEIKNGHTYIYTNEIKGLGGYPVGVQGKGLLMLSGGIDSPVAGYLALKRGIDVECIYFDSPPHTSIEAKNKVIDLANILNKYSGKIKIFVVPFTKLQETIYKNVQNEYMITIMRRMMYRIAHKLALKNKCKVIINGESIGQVASQTLTSINTINSVTNFPIIRPVCCLDKLEIIEISKKIGTYDISIRPYEDCCTVFVPKHPSINPDINKCLEFEKNFDYETLIDEAINNVQVIYKLDRNKHSDLL